MVVVVRVVSCVWWLGQAARCGLKDLTIMTEIYANKRPVAMVVMIKKKILGNVVWSGAMYTTCPRLQVQYLNPACVHLPSWYLHDLLSWQSKHLRTEFFIWVSASFTVTLEKRSGSFITLPPPPRQTTLTNPRTSHTS